tara:strand:- start:2291 stop:3166 length:876 start_codon:yes stop_codon:yes gene_type:complete
LKKLEKVIIPIAGLGTRMLPATKAIPKEMLPIVDKPIIQYIVEEAIEAGFKEIIFITHSSKYLVENHFDTNFELETTLEKRVKRSLLKEIRSISRLKILIHSIRQGEPKGLGHAILCAKHLVSEEPFGVMLPDMVILNNDDRKDFCQMKKKFDEVRTSSILLGKAKKNELDKYGVVKLKKSSKIKNNYISNIVEKPSLKKAPSNLFVVGRYIFNNNLMKYLEEVDEDKSGEIQLTDAINLALKNDEKISGINSNGQIFDCGNKLGYLFANIQYAKRDPEIKKHLLDFLNKN